jgi:hypothetical protein
MVRLGADLSLLRLSLAFMRRRIPRQTRTGAALALSIARTCALANSLFG